MVATHRMQAAGVDAFGGDLLDLAAPAPPAPDEVVISSEGTMASRGACAVAERLGTTPVRFPSHHAGFLGGEHGQAGKPEEFATKLREVLAEGR